jgi:hypothetical protein
VLSQTVQFLSRLIEFESGGGIAVVAAFQGAAVRERVGLDLGRVLAGVVGERVRAHPRERDVRAGGGRRGEEREGRQRRQRERVSAEGTGSHDARP